MQIGPGFILSVSFVEFVRVHQTTHAADLRVVIPVDASDARLFANRPSVRSREPVVS